MQSLDSKVVCFAVCINRAGHNLDDPTGGHWPGWVVDVVGHGELLCWEDDGRCLGPPAAAKQSAFEGADFC